MGLTLRSNAASPCKNDPEWMPSEGNKNSGRVYGGKKPRKHSRKDSQQKPQKAVPKNTPFLKKLLRHDSDGSPIDQPCFGGRNVMPQSRQVGRKSGKTSVMPSTTLDEAYHSLWTAFKPFLTGTRSVTEPERIGARSLRDMCLRGVPRHIEYEQQLGIEEDEDGETDASADTYAFLENLGPREGRGFPGLRQVARWHGMGLLAKAIKEQLLPWGIVEVLVRTCILEDLVVEAQTLIDAWSTHDEQLTKERLAVIRYWNGMFKSQAYLSRQLAGLLESGKTSLTIISDGEVWPLTLRRLETSREGFDTMRVVQAYVLALLEERTGVDRYGELVQHVTESVRQHAIYLTTRICIVKHGDSEVAHKRTLAWQLSHMLHKVLSRHESAIVSGTCKMSRVVEPFFVAALLSYAAGPMAYENMLEIDVELLIACMGTGWLPKASCFLLHVAKSLAYVDGPAAKDMFEAMVVGLLKVSSAHHSCTSKSLRSMATESARLWAEEWNDNESYDFAERIEDLASSDKGRSSAGLTPASSKPVKYRYEAGLCEWVAATPFAARRNVSQESSRDNKGSSVCIATLQSRASKRSSSFRAFQDGPELEIDELGMSTPELAKLEQRATKRARIDQRLAANPENNSAAAIIKFGSIPQTSFNCVADICEDELDCWRETNGGLPAVLAPSSGVVRTT